VSPRPETRRGLGGVRDRLSAAATDVRALRSGAPLRLALELSKRTGLHAALFGRLAKQVPPELTFVLPFAPPTVTGIPDAVRERTLREAATIATGTIEIFGVPLDLGTDLDWHATLDGPERWPALPWWQIDIRSSARLGDVKWTWELGRHRHLVVLARATALDPNGEWAAVLEQQLTSWLDANPVEIGVHWYSNLEIALRSIAWVQVLGLAGSQLPEPLRARMYGVLHHCGRHLLADVPYTVSTMRNNHLVGDALGLSVIGRCFPDDRRARRWRAAGDRLFERQRSVQMHDDGSMVEDSVSYHRFVLEMFAVRVLLGDATAETKAALAQAAAFLVRLGALDGDVPRYGDGDEGRVFVAATDRTDHADRSCLSGSVHAALAIAGTTDGGDATAVLDAFGAFDEVAWYVPRREGTNEPVAAATTTVTTTTTAAAEAHGQSIGGGLARAEVGPFTAWLKAGGDWSHGHADLCAAFIRVDDAWAVGDPGTGTYNGSADQRDYFRTSVAHPVLRLAGHDQLEPHRAFRWRYPAVGAVGSPIEVAGHCVMWGWHGSYRRLDPSRRVARAVVLSGGDAAMLGAGDQPVGAAVTVIDWVEGPVGVPFALTLPLPPGSRFENDHIRLATRRSLPLRLATAADVAVTSRSGHADPFDGWWSPVYGSVEPSVRVEIAGAVQGPLAWQLGATTAAAAPVLSVTDDEVSIGDLTVLASFTSAGINLAVRAPAGPEQSSYLDT